MSTSNSTPYNLNKETKQKERKKISTPKSTPFKRKEEENQHTQKHTVQLDHTYKNIRGEKQE